MTKKDFEGKKVAILGLGVDTRDVIPWLKTQGAMLTVLAEPFGDLTRFGVVVRSPGVYRYRPEVVAAEKAGVVVTSKTKIFFDVCPAKIIGVTGTKGKGTTSTLIYEMLKAGGKKVFLGGNIGKGVFEFLGQLDSDSWVVLELSSFQLIDLHKSPQVAVVLMTLVDHLDWHKDEREYLMAKANLVKFQSTKDLTVANNDYEGSVWIGEQGKSRKTWVNRRHWTYATRLKGEHNRENLAAAAEVAREAGVAEEKIRKVAAEFKGLEHRLEEVATVDGVTYFDDSFSTTPETTIAAIEAFEEPKVMILGGSEKGSDFTSLGEAVRRAKNIRAVIVIGLMAERLRKAIGGVVEVVDGGLTMGQIVGKARKLAQPGDVVVLSPAAASFDMFKNYKDRGEQFKIEVYELSHIVVNSHR